MGMNQPILIKKIIIILKYLSVTVSAVLYFLAMYRGQISYKRRFTKWINAYLNSRGYSNKVNERNHLWATSWANVALLF